MGLSLIKHIHMHQKKRRQLNQIALHTHLRESEIVATEKSGKRMIITKKSHNLSGNTLESVSIIHLDIRNDGRNSLDLNF